MTDFDTLRDVILRAGSLGLTAVWLSPAIWDLCWEEYETIYPELEKRNVEKTRQFIFAGVRVIGTDEKN